MAIQMTIQVIKNQLRKAESQNTILTKKGWKQDAWQTDCTGKGKG